MYLLYCMHCMELCNDIWTLHVFCLRCSTLQDVVQLIEELETACIRFVHFSKENELRSRVSVYTSAAVVML